MREASLSATNNKFYLNTWFSEYRSRGFSGNRVVGPRYGSCNRKNITAFTTLEDVSIAAAQPLRTGAEISAVGTDIPNSWCRSVLIRRPGCTASLTAAVRSPKNETVASMSVTT
jgi:hypothetical protein